MLAVVTPGEMRDIDAAAPEPADVLIERAGGAVARAALEMLGGSYGRRVIVIAGKGNNGADGRAAAKRLEQRGVRVEIFAAEEAPGASFTRCDLVIDAAYGTGFRGEWYAPDVGAAQVLAVDIPSGVDGTTGEINGRVLAASRTITFAAYKPGLLLGKGAEVAGDIEIADIGLDVSSTRTYLVEDDDVKAWFPRRANTAHKWMSGVWVIAGSPGMTGAAMLATRGAQRGGAGYVRLSTPGVIASTAAIPEAVGFLLSEHEWADEVIESIDRFSSLVIGPGVGREKTTVENVRRLVGKSPIPTVVDGDALVALGEGSSRTTRLEELVRPFTVLTPHDGEYQRLTGEPVGPDRLASVRQTAGSTGCTVLLKGPTTVVADPSGNALVVTSGDSRLATAGSGDVLSGIIGAFLARGMPPLHAAGAAAHLHGRTCSLGPTEGMLAGDLPEFLPAALHAMLES